MRILHIHTDLKFINSSDIFEGYELENFNIILANNSYEKNINNFIYLKPTKENIKKIIEYAANSDLVVLYNLDNIKSYIANRVPTNVKIAWRFFGQELYSKIPDSVFSKLTKEALKPNLIENLKKKFEEEVRYKFSRFKWSINFNQEFDKAISRIDLFLGYSEDEFIYLKKYWAKLPRFIPLPIPEIFYNEVKIFDKKPILIIGNNRSAYNNHLDIINIIKHFQSNEYIFLILFNYGKENAYAKRVRNVSKNISSIKLQNDYLNINEFNKLYENTSAFVLNGYRQMALFNIFNAIKYGVKIYLNEKNIIYNWLKQNKFNIFNIDNLKDDLLKNNIKLNKDEAIINISLLNGLIRNYNKHDFQKVLLELIK